MRTSIGRLLFNAARHACLLLFLALCGPVLAIAQVSGSTYAGSAVIAGISYPPFADPRQIDFSINALKSLNIDRIRISIDWRNREPNRGEYNWEPMDRRMAAARENSIQVFLTIHNIGPEWAYQRQKGSLEAGPGSVVINKDHLRSFFRALLQRYSIDKIQFGNEWEYDYAASAEEFVACTNILYETVRAFSPDTKVVLGGLTRSYPIMKQFREQGRYPDFSDIKFSHGFSEEKLISKLKRSEEKYSAQNVKIAVEWVLKNAKYDFIDLHLYDDPLNWAEYLKAFTTDKPILVSEFGGPSSEFERTSKSYQAQRMPVYLQVIKSLPITEAYYFKLTDSNSYHAHTGLYTNILGGKKKVYSVFAREISVSF